MKRQFDIPILFIVFNRPSTTEKVFQKICEIKPARLFIAGDGPRPSKEGEKEKCEAVRSLILNGIDWDCEVQTKFSDVNLGCGLAVSGAITWFFDNIEEGIILEDDTLPDLSFFAFCKELLEKYRHDEKVKLISGNNFQNGKWRGEGSYYFSAHSYIWGWASWRRTWKEYDYSLRTINTTILDSLLDFYFFDKATKKYWIDTFSKVKNGEFNTWDIQLLFSIWQKKGKTVVPNLNLVKNIGFGSEATHTNSINDKRTIIELQTLDLIKHPSNLEIDTEADKYTFRFFFREDKKFISLFKKRLKNIFLDN